MLNDDILRNVLDCLDPFERMRTLIKLGRCRILYFYEGNSGGKSEVCMDIIVRGRIRKEDGCIVSYPFLITSYDMRYAGRAQCTMPYAGRKICNVHNNDYFLFKDTLYGKEYVCGNTCIARFFQTDIPERVKKYKLRVKKCLKQPISFGKYKDVPIEEVLQREDGKSYIFNWLQHLDAEPDSEAGKLKKILRKNGIF